MLKTNKLRASICALAIFSAPVGIAAELSDTGEFIDGIAAIVNEGVVLKSQLREQTALIIERASRADPPMQLPPANILREQLLERLIVTEIQLQRAERIGLQISDQAVNDAIGRGGVVLIPAFAVDRTEIVLWHLAELRRRGELPEIPVYVDSPMASAALRARRGDHCGERCSGSVREYR